MFNLITKLNSSNFSKNVLKLMTGTIVAQLLSFASQPILTRLFTPSDYGKLASIQAIISIFTVFCALSYERAIVLTPNEEEANSVAGLSIQLTIALGIIFSVTLLNSSIWHSMFGFILPNYIKLLLPLWFIAAGLTGVFNNLHNRTKNYSFLARNRIIIGLLGIIIQLIAGYADTGVNGLILANIIGVIIGLISVSITLFAQIVPQTINNHKYYATKYKEFPYYQLPGAILDITSLQIMVILLNKLLGSEIAGQYSLANRVLAIPLSLIGGAFAQVFYQEFAQRFAENNDPKGFLLRTWQKLFLLGIIPCIILFFWGEPLFQLVFGAKWLTAGWFAKYLCIMTFLMLINSPTSTALIILNEQKWFFFITILYCIFRIGSLLLIPTIGLRHSLICYIAFEIMVIILYNIPILLKLQKK
jgi:O-antigen/teichoic acid export membrane protein